MPYLTLISNGNPSDASQLDQVINVLQRQSGQTEQGKYFVMGGGYQSGWTVSNWIVTLSRSSTPASVTIDTVDTPPTQAANPPITTQLKSSGFAAQFSTSTLTNTARAGGNFSVQY